MSYILVPYLHRQSSRETPKATTVVVWDLDETLVTCRGDCVLYRQDLIAAVMAIKALPSVVNVLWTRGNLPHMIDMIRGTLLAWGFDEYLWDDHANECKMNHGKYKHPQYLDKLFSNKSCKFILIDDGEENCRGWPASICIKGLDGASKATSAIEVFARVAGLCANANAV